MITRGLVMHLFCVAACLHGHLSNMSCFTWTVGAESFWSLFTFSYFTLRLVQYTLGLFCSL